MDHFRPLFLLCQRFIFVNSAFFTISNSSEVHIALHNNIDLDLLCAQLSQFCQISVSHLLNLNVFWFILDSLSLLLGLYVVF